MQNTYVLDTNVILYDPRCIFSFKESHIIIPIVVLEEIDTFKKGQDQINRNARVFDNYLNELTETSDSIKSIAIPDTGSTITVDTKMHTAIKGLPEKNDNIILACAKAHGAIIVSKDTNLRLKAKSYEIPAQDYRYEDIPDIMELYQGYRSIQVDNSNLVDDIYHTPEGVSPATLGIDLAIPNEYFLINNHTQSVLAQCDPVTGNIKAINVPYGASNIYPLNLEQKFALHALMDPNINLVTLTGIAGCGKTLLSIAAAIESKTKYPQIFLSRPVMPLGKDIGYLPGTLEEKMDPYMQPLWDNLSVVKNAKKQGKGKTKDADDKKSEDAFKKMIEEEKIIVEALTYIRGRSLPRIFFIVDEAQNLTPHEIKTIVTRAGKDTKIVFTGDIYQIDHPYLDSTSNGLSYLIHKFKGQKIYAHVNLVKGERSELAEIASSIL